ncbi:MAG: GNAT family N-acetyltransferase [Chitinophagaceae bacterium]|nr:GNAT family N-acetyltransferase [Chitinophagaceae bacterium]
MASDITAGAIQKLFFELFKTFSFANYILGITGHSADNLRLNSMNIKTQNVPVALQSRAERRALERKIAKATQRTEYRTNTTLLRTFHEELLELLKDQWPIEYCDAGNNFFCNLDNHNNATVIKCDYIVLYHLDLFNIKIVPGKGDSIEIYRFEVYQTGCGIGTKLMNFLNTVSLMTKIPLELVIGTLGIGKTFRSDTHPKRQMAFYEKLGFVRIGRTNCWKNTDAPYSMLLQIAQTQN